MIMGAAVQGVQASEAREGRVLVAPVHGESLLSPAQMVPWVCNAPVSPRLPGGKDPFWQGFQCEEKKMERAVDEDHDFGGMCVKLGQVKRLGRVV